MLALHGRTDTWVSVRFSPLIGVPTVGVGASRQGEGKNGATPPEVKPARKKCNMRADMQTEKTPPKRMPARIDLGTVFVPHCDSHEVGARGTGEFGKGGGGGPQPGTRPEIVGPPPPHQEPGHG